MARLFFRRKKTVRSESEICYAPKKIRLEKLFRFCNSFHTKLNVHCRRQQVTFWRYLRLFFAKKNRKLRERGMRFSSKSTILIFCKFWLLLNCCCKLVRARKKLYVCLQLSLLEFSPYYYDLRRTVFRYAKKACGKDFFGGKMFF